MKSQSEFHFMKQVKTRTLASTLVDLHCLWGILVLCAQLCQTLCDPTDCSPVDSSVHRSLRGRILEWVAMVSSRGSSPPQGSNPHLLHWQVHSLLLSHLGSPENTSTHGLVQHHAAGVPELRLTGGSPRCRTGICMASTWKCSSPLCCPLCLR